MANFMDHYHRVRRAILPASKQDVAWRHEAIDFRLATIEKTLNSLSAAAHQALAKSGEPNPQDLQTSLERYKLEAKARQIIGHSMIRFCVLGLRTPDVTTTLEETKPYYALPVEEVLNHPMIAEDFSIFKHFDKSSQTVLDIGAHVGFAVSAMVRAGCLASILSIEPNRLHHDSLKRLRQRLHGKFDFLGYGLSNKDGSIRFIVPVVEGAAQTTLSTTEIEIAMAWSIPENLLLYCLNVIPHVAEPRIQFCEEFWSVARLDDLLTHEKPEVPVDDIVAVKIVAEGHEANVVEGARETLARCRPMIMIAGGNRAERVDKQLRELGYVFSEYREGSLRVQDTSSRYHGFYLHRDRLSAYVAAGMVVAS